MTSFVLTDLPLDELQRRTRRTLNNMRSMLRRKHLTGWVKERDVSGHYRDALRLVLAIEDAYGVEAAASLSDRLTALRQEATAAHLLSVEQVVRIEREVVS
jgi:hypothetical protein